MTTTYSPAVIAALWELHRRTGDAPTIEELAEYLELDRSAVNVALLDLRRQRLFRDHHRTRPGGTRRVWEPWAGHW